jgi:hypothetical protein
MYIGHFGVAFAAKRLAPKTSLATLFAATEFLDILWPALLLANVEHVRIAPGITRMAPLDFYHYPISHSLLMVCGWAVLFGTAYWIFRRNARGAWVVGALILSHWLLDAVVHRPDLPLTPFGRQMVGFGLWNNWVLAITVELFLFGFGLLVYLQTTANTDRLGNGALLGLVTCLLVTWLASLFGRNPPGVRAIAVVALTMTLFIPWGAWVDHHRRPKKWTEAEDEFLKEKRATTDA